MNRQKDKLLAFFKERPDTWIALPEILQLGIAQYNARIHDIRKEGIIIENRWEVIEGVKHSWFRYIPAKETQQVFA
jgi:hypothetical protein